MGLTPVKYRLAAVTWAFGGGVWLSDFIHYGLTGYLVGFVVMTGGAAFFYNRGNN